ncbi:39468_t:CDS:1, partial [Gigaspora margarita]
IAFLNIYNKSEDKVLKLLISKLLCMAPFICQYIKKDSSICGKGCWRAEVYAKHYNACLKTICPICNERTYSDTRICSMHSGIYDHAWHENKKTKIELIPLGSFNMINT